jgi:hypothetical protein
MGAKLHKESRYLRWVPEVQEELAHAPFRDGTKKILNVNI